MFARSVEHMPIYALLPAEQSLLMIPGSKQTTGGCPWSCARRVAVISVLTLSTAPPGHSEQSAVRHPSEPTTSIRASLNISGSVFPRFSARLRIPAHALGLKQYFSGAFRSKICDKVDSLPSLGDSPKLSVIHTPGNAVAISHDAPSRLPLPPIRRSRYRNCGIADFAERLEDGVEVSSLV